MRDELSFALLVVLERLTPEQRVAFVLHDVFAVPFAEIAAALGTTAEAARQLATRARQAVEPRPGSPGRRYRWTSSGAWSPRSSPRPARATSTGLLAVLAPDVVIVGDGGGIVPAGPLAAWRVRSPWPGSCSACSAGPRPRRAIEFVPVLVNGEVGLVGEVRAHRSRAHAVVAGRPR